MSPQYQDFTIEDFIADEYFYRWVVSPDEESARFWEKFIQEHPEKQSDIARAISFINNLHIDTDLPSDVQVEQSLQRNLSRIQSLETMPSISPKKRRVASVFAQYAAAAILAAVIATLSFYYWNSKPLTIEVITGVNEIKNVVLPDSSVITLNGSSSLTYSGNFGEANKREVWLDGEAFFNVRNLSRERKEPVSFVVHSGDLNVEVLGTSFNVKKTGVATNVTLNTGKIRISVNDDPSASLLMNPGDFMQYSPTERKIVKKQVKAELYSVWKDDKYVLNDLSLAEIAHFIEDSYGYEVKISDSMLARSRMSGTLRTSDAEAVLSTISFVLDLDVVKRDNMIIFQPKQKIK